jgi:hypothetical protein
LRNYSAYRLSGSRHECAFHRQHPGGSLIIAGILINLLHQRTIRAGIGHISRPRLAWQPIFLAVDAPGDWLTTRSLPIEPDAVLAGVGHPARARDIGSVEEASASAADRIVEGLGVSGISRRLQPLNRFPRPESLVDRSAGSTWAGLGSAPNLLMDDCAPERVALTCPNHGQLSFAHHTSRPPAH